MKTYWVKDCLTCLFVDTASDCGLYRLRCRLENRSCVSESLLNPGNSYKPARVKPPAWCPLPVVITPDEIEFEKPTSLRCSLCFKEVPVSAKTTEVTCEQCIAKKAEEKSIK